MPTSPDTGLDPLTVRSHVPAVWVLLSRDPLRTPMGIATSPLGVPPDLEGPHLPPAVALSLEEGLEIPGSEDLWASCCLDCLGWLYL